MHNCSLTIASLLNSGKCMNWNDLKYLLALSRLGTLSAVAKETGVDMTTVSRRLKALEGSLGAQLFQRIDSRYLPTEALQQVLRRAEQVEIEIGRLESDLLGQDEDLRGRVRITSVHTFINSYLLQRLPDFYQRYPDIELEIVADSSQLDLGRHEADLALRMGRPDQSSIVTRRMADLNYALYGHQTLVENRQEIADLPWVLFEDRFHNLPEALWQQQHYPNVQARLFCNVGPAMLTAASNGLGVACLPCYMAEPVAGLVALTEAFPLRALWLLMHPEKRNLARIRAFVDWLEQQLENDTSLFMGTATASEVAP